MIQTSYLLALDQGTTSCRAILFDKEGQIVGIEQKEIKQYFPKDGWVEHDGMEIWNTQLLVTQKLINRLRVSPHAIAGIGITNQRETTLVWDKTTGKPIHKAIVWQDRRTADICQQLSKLGLDDYVQKNTGLVIDAYFSGTKLHWILQNVEGAQQRAEKGELLFGTMDTWLLWKLTGGSSFMTDYSNASRTMLFNIHSLKWDEKLLKQLNIPMAMMPQVGESSQIFGHSEVAMLGERIPIAGMAGDQQAALFGQLCFEPGMAKNTYGTGCFLLMNTGEAPVHSKSGLITTIAWGLNGKVHYALEGSVFIAGAAIQWLRDGMKMIKSTKASEIWAEKVPDAEGLVMVPAFVGLGAPYWDMYARGAVFGITRATTKAHFIRAALESLAFQTKDVLDAMQTDSNMDLRKLKVDGGASANDFLMQFQADILQTTVERPKYIESTAIGVAYLAGLATGFWSLNALQEIWALDKTFMPTMEQEYSRKKYMLWQKAIERTKNWLED